MKDAYQAPALVILREIEALEFRASNFDIAREKFEALQDLSPQRSLPKLFHENADVLVWECPSCGRLIEAPIPELEDVGVPMCTECDRLCVDASLLYTKAALRYAMILCASGATAQFLQIISGIEENL